MLRRSALFDNRSVRCEVPVQDRDSAFGVQGLIARADYGVISRLSAADVFANGLAVHSRAIAVELILNPMHDGWDAAGVKQIFHQILARRLDVDNASRAPRNAVEILERQIDAETPGDRNQMDDGIGGTAQRHQDGDGVLEGRPRHDA